jgi:hypothetical protein
MTKLFKVFSKLPREKHLHIVTQRPTIDLNCHILNENPRSIFSVRITQTDTVAFLSKLIKEQSMDALHDIPARDLVLWRVSLPVDDTLERSLESLIPDQQEILLHGAVMSNMFKTPPSSEHIHIIVERPHTSEL